VPVFSPLTGTTTHAAFETVLNPNPSLFLDRLEITMNRAAANYNIDNIVVDSAPETASHVLVVAGLATLAIFRRRIKM
jgi:hypothetical protein